MKSKSELGKKKRQLPEEDSGFEFLYEEKGNGVPERAAREAEAPVFNQGEGSGLKSRKGRIFSDSDSPGFIERKSRISLSPPFSLISSTFPLLQTSTMKPSASSSSCIAKRTRSQLNLNLKEYSISKLEKTKRSRLELKNEEKKEDDQITKIGTINGEENVRGFGRNKSHDEDKYESNPDSPEFYCLSSDSEDNENEAGDEDVKKDRNFEPDSGSLEIYTISSDSDDEEKEEQKVNLIEKSRSEEEAEDIESDSESEEDDETQILVSIETHLGFD